MMRKLLLTLIMVLATSATVFAAKIPTEMQQYVENTFPKTNFRFDGVIILPDSTMYLPLFPAKAADIEKLEIKRTIPANKTLAQKPEIVIFNNNYVLLRVINDPSGKKTILAPNPAPAEVANGLLPQDMLVPKGLIIPENFKGIIGNLNVDLAENAGLKVSVPQPKNGKNTVVPVPQLKNKTFYVATGYSKNIQVINSENKNPAYALAQNYVPNSMKAYNNQYLIVTSYGTDIANVISLADEDVIKQIHFTSVPDEILIDTNKKIAYVSSSAGESIFIVNLETMTLSKQIKINGMCEKITLSDDGSKIFYFDKKTNEIWAIELDNNYLLKDIGTFPNVSKIAFKNNKIYITSRTKGHLAIVDYDTNGLIAEVPITTKPVDMITFEDNLFILGATDNVIQVLNTKTDELTDSIYLNTKGFSTHIDRIENTNLAIVSDSRASIYCVLDMKTKQVVKASAIEVPIRTIVVTDQVTKTNK